MPSLYDNTLFSVPEPAPLVRNIARLEAEVYNGQKIIDFNMPKGAPNTAATQHFNACREQLLVLVARYQEKFPILRTQLEHYKKFGIQKVHLTETSATLQKVLLLNTKQLLEEYYETLCENHQKPDAVMVKSYALTVCFTGILSNLQFMLSLFRGQNLQKNVVQAKINFIDQYALVFYHNIILMENQIETAVRDGNEIHIINGLFNVVADDYKLLPREDMLINAAMISRYYTRFKAFIALNINHHQLVENMMAQLPLYIPNPAEYTYRLMSELPAAGPAPYVIYLAKVASTLHYQVLNHKNAGSKGTLALSLPIDNPLIIEELAPDLKLKILTAICAQGHVPRDAKLKQYNGQAVQDFFRSGDNREHDAELEYGILYEFEEKDGAYQLKEHAEDNHRLYWMRLLHEKGLIPDPHFTIEGRSFIATKHEYIEKIESLVNRGQGEERHITYRILEDSDLPFLEKHSAAFLSNTTPIFQKCVNTALLLPNQELPTFPLLSKISTRQLLASPLLNTELGTCVLLRPLTLAEQESLLNHFQAFCFKVSNCTLAILEGLRKSKNLVFFQSFLEYAPQTPSFFKHIEKTLFQLVADNNLAFFKVALKPFTDTTKTPEALTFLRELLDAVTAQNNPEFWITLFADTPILAEHLTEKREELLFNAIRKNHLQFVHYLLSKSKRPTNPTIAGFLNFPPIR